MNSLKLMFEVYHHQTQKRLTLCETHVRLAQERHGKYLTVNSSNEKDAKCDVCPKKK